MSQEAISSQRRRRATTKGSITRNRLKDLSEQVTEGSPSEVISHAKLLLNKLETLDTDFKKCHFALIELIEEPGVLDQEQKTLDEHDDEVAVLAKYPIISTSLNSLTYWHRPLRHQLPSKQRDQAELD